MCKETRRFFHKCNGESFYLVEIMFKNDINKNCKEYRHSFPVTSLFTKSRNLSRACILFKNISKIFE